MATSDRHRGRLGHGRWTQREQRREDHHEDAHQAGQQAGYRPGVDAEVLQAVDPPCGNEHHQAERAPHGSVQELPAILHLTAARHPFIRMPPLQRRIPIDSGETFAMPAACSR